MRAITIQGARLRLEQLPDPDPKEGQLLVAPLFNGICGSDLHRRAQMRADQEAHDGDPSSLTKIVPGHEFCSEVVAIGPGTQTELKPGDRVVALPFTPGPAPLNFINIGLSPERGGGLASLSLVDAERSFRVPDAVPSDLAALTEPLSVGQHAVNLANRHSGPNLVVGCGPIGLAIILLLRAEGRGAIIAADFSQSRREMATKLGADIVIDPAETSPFESWRDVAFSPDPPAPLLPRTFTGQPSGMNIFECTGSPAVLQQIMQAAPQHCHVIYAGICNHEVKHVPRQAILRELAIDYCFAYTPREFASVLKMIEQKPDIVRQLITSVFPLADTEKAFDRLVGGGEDIKILIDVQS